MNPIDFFPLILIAGIAYFLIFRPAQQERAAHDALIAGLAVDDWVVCSGGIWGRIVKVGPETAVIEIADRTRVTFDKKAVLRKVEADSARTARELG